MINPLLGIILMAYITDVCLITPTDKQITVTFHRYRKSWNRAQAICEALGGTLFIEDSEEKAFVLAKYRVQSSWSDPLAYSVWIGLHSLEIDSSYVWVYGKPTCQPVENSIHSNWKSGQPKNEAASRCAIQDKSSSNWITWTCQWTLYKFICEKQESTSCTFTAKTGTPKSSLSSQNDTQTLSKSDANSCRDECLSSVYNDMNCWAATYEVGSCVLYYMSDPFLLTDSANIESSSRQLFVKNCYQSAVDTTDDTTVTADNLATPDEGCASLITTAPTSSKSSTTTSTTSATTIFTSVTTTQSPTTSTTVGISVTTTDAVLVNTTPTTSTDSVTKSTATGSESSTLSSSSAIPSATDTSSLSTISSPTETSKTVTGLSVTTPSLTTSAKSATTSITTSTTKCTCACNDYNNLYRNFSINPEFANLTTDEIVEKIIEKLKVNKSSLSATIRKKISAKDNRTSSVSVGVVAIIFMAIVFGFLVAGDGIHFTSYIVHKFSTSPSDEMEMK